MPSLSVTGGAQSWTLLSRPWARAPARERPKHRQRAARLTPDGTAASPPSVGEGLVPSRGPQGRNPAPSSTATEREPRT